MAELRIESLTKRFAEEHVLRQIDLTVRDGEFLSLLGPSGCGKSTLLRIVAGLERASSGRLLVDGEDIGALAPERRQVALMFQSYALLPHMTVHENVRFPLRMQRRLTRARQYQRSLEVLDLVKLADLAERFPSQLSGGQQQRVALARAVVAEPKLLLLDEPLSNLDARLREDMQVELKSIHATLGFTTVFVTHDQEEALGLSDTVALMHRGRIEQTDTPEALYRRPRTAFAADFIGGANVIDLDLVREGGAWLGRLGEGLRFPVSAPSDGQPGPRQAMLRQEAVRLGPAAVRGPLALPARIETRVYHGGSVRSIVRLGPATLKALTPAVESPRRDGETTIGWDPDDLVILDLEGRG